MFCLSTKEKEKKFAWKQMTMSDLHSAGWATHPSLPISIWPYQYRNRPAVQMYTCVSQNTDTEFPESTEIATWTNASWLPVKPIVEHWWGVIVRWHLRILSHFRGWSIQPVLIGQEGLLNQMHRNFTEVSHLPIGGFEYKAVSDKWLHETDKEEEESMKPRKQTPTRQQPFKKWHFGIREIGIYSALFLESLLLSSIENDLNDVNKMKSSECSASI